MWGHNMASSPQKMFLILLPDRWNRIGNIIKDLGDVLTDRLRLSARVDNIVCKAVQSFIALHILVAHGVFGSRLNNVLCFTTVARMLYSVWWGFAPTLLYLTWCVLNLFSAVFSKPGHVLHDLLPPEWVTGYSLRPQSHNREMLWFVHCKRIYN